MLGFEVDQEVSSDELEAALHSNNFLFAPCGFIQRRSDIGLNLLRKQCTAIKEIRDDSAIPNGSGYSQIHENSSRTINAVFDIARCSYQWALKNNLIYCESDISGRNGITAAQCWGVHPCKLYDLFRILLPSSLYTNFVSQLPPKYRLDKIMFHTATNVIGHGSTQWHRDSVGNRFKIFLVLETGIMSPTTAIVSNSQYELPYAMNVDLIRTLQGPNGCKNVGLAKSVQDQITYSLEKRFRSNVKVIEQKKGTVVMFDTNSWHMAWKPCMQGSEESYDTRIVLELEYMDQERSNFAADFLGPCAPGQNLTYWYLEDESQELLDFFRIDSKCTHTVTTSSGDHIKFYSSANRVSRWCADIHAFSKLIDNTTIDNL